MNNTNKNPFLFSNQINLSSKVIDKSEKILDGTINCIKELNLDCSRLAIPLQRHTGNIIWTTEPGEFKNCDGIITNLKYSILLSLCVADCVPVCIFDEVTGNFGLIHSGWRGTLAKISINGVNLIMKNGSNINDIIIYLGPSISQKHYEVDIEVASLFSESSYIKKEEKYLLDIKGQIKQDLMEVGLSPDQIFKSRRCTYQDANLPSYRRDGPQSSRLIFLMRKNNE